MSQSLHEKRARLRSLLQKAPEATATVPEIEPRGQRSDLEPLSFAQEALWFVWQLEGPNPAYNNACLARLSGAVDVAALHRAVRTIVARHDALRTRFVDRGGVPSQTVADSVDVTLEPQWVMSGEAEAVYQSDATQPFDITADRLFRIKLFREAADRFVLVVSLHHSISDAQSIGIFLRELATLYEAYRAGRDETLEPLPVTYIDYVHWQRDWLGGGVLERQLAYWRDRLKDLPPLLALPTDHPRPALQRSHGGTVAFAVPAPLRDALTTIGSEHRCSLFVVLLSALAVLLHRYSLQRDLAIGTGVSNRRSPELEGVIGFFVNTLVLRIEVSPEQSFTSLLNAAREIVQQALANQDAPYHRVVQELRPDRSAAYSPLFQVMLTLQNAASTRRIELPSVSMELPSSGAAKFDLSIAVQEEPDGLAAQIEYRADIFEERTVQRLADHYVQVLRQIARQPELEIGQHAVLTDVERRLLIEDWSGRDRVATTGQSIHGIFESRVHERPTTPALVHRDRVLTYGELNARANRLARHLRGRGVGEDTIVGISLERGFDLIVAVLGVLKAGGAYLPLDPDNPVERTQSLLDDAGVPLVITSTPMRATVPVDAARLVLVDGVFDSVFDGTAPAPAAGTQGDRDHHLDLESMGTRGERALAYVMYTSGSTGQPRGVAVEHRGVTRLVRETNWIALDETTVTIQHSPVSFDASTFEIWAALLNGGTLVLRDGDAADVEGLAEQVARHGVNTLWLSAGVLPLWLDLPEPGSRAARLRYLLVGGDVVLEKHVRTVYARDPDVVVINGYGPTENTTFSCCFPVPRAAIAAGSLPIGKPISGTSAYVLDEQLQVQPIGSVGELFVGGAGLARGYLNQPGLTARSFVRHPFSIDPEDRLYRTSDRVRWLASGDLEFLGRVDNQVKIRGYRVELEEIELRLLQLPEVAMGAVVARDDATLGKRLIAYIVRSDTAAAADEPRDRLIQRCKVSLRTTLPEYMVPSTFVLCDTLPLTANGKVDRRRLPDPDEGDLHRQDYRAPATDTERVLCAIWQEVLHLERVGVDDSFFDLGGHSLLGTQLVAQIRDRLGKRLPLNELFQHPTVGGVASWLARETQAATPDVLPSIRADAVHRDEPFPMTGVQQAYLLGRSGAFELGNISTHAYVEIELSDVDLPRLEWAWNVLITRHDMLRAVFAADGTQRILPAVPHYAIVYDDVRGLPGEAQAAHLARVRDTHSHQIFTASEWPLFEIRGTRLTDRRVRMHFSVDALPSDAMSSLILVRELDRLYMDPATTLPELTVSFRDYVLALDEIHATPLYGRARAYWERRAPLLPAAPDLPLAKDPGEIARPRFARRDCVLDAALWESLQEQARAIGVTPSALLVSAFARVLGAWSRTAHFTLTLTLFNRLPVHPQVDELVGDFTSLTLLEIDGRERQSLGDFARRIQSQLWSDIEHRTFDGIDVLRLLNRRANGGKPVLMPVVFTSTLGLVGGEDERNIGPIARALSNLSADGNFGITQTSQVWLDNVVSETQGKLTITWDAIDELFPAGVLDAMFAAYRTLLTGLAAGTVQRTDACVPIAPESQIARRRHVNATEADLPDGLLQDLFRQQAQSRPNATAVIQGDVTLTYADFDRRARAIARQLRARGARRNELIGVVMVKGWEQIAAVLGVLYAGAAYLPIDAALPPDRIALLLAQGEVRIALTQGDSDRRIAWPADIDVLPVDRRDVDRSDVDRSDAADDTVASAAVPEDLAYVIFTSGSTGMPKGVMIDHRGALNTIVDMNRRFAVTANDCVLGLSSLSFDLSVYDIFGVLGAGGTLVLPDRSREADTGHWVDLVERHGVTVWNTVPILAQLFVDELTKDSTRASRAAASLRVVLMSGDWIPLPLPARLRACAPDAMVVSLGGATEASIWSIFHVIDRVDPSWTSIPYGRPLANQRFHVLAKDLSPSPDWVAGDLYIAGVGLAKGYWRDEEKTRRSFVSHPVTGERLYRTGDLGRYWPDGTIEFLGREDTQVKVHGHRIELGEIEAALLQHDAVAAAAVAIVGDGQDRRIVAYVVPTERPDDSVRIIRDPAQRAAFTLEQRGLRRFPPETETIPLAAADRGVSTGRDANGRESWGRWLSALAQVPIEGHALPKRRYPSAGSLYPVQVYVSLTTAAVEGLTAGCYYYDPASHSLRRLSRAPLGLQADTASASGFGLFVVASKEAIAPLYGGETDRFCRLEAGHVIGLLASTAPAHGIQFARVDGPDESVLRGVLPRDGVLLASYAGEVSRAGEHESTLASPTGTTAVLRALMRQSYREFLADGLDVASLVDLLAATPDEGVALYVYIKPGKDANASGSHAGFFKFDRSSKQLIQTAAPDDAFANRIHAIANREVQARAAFSLYLVAGPGTDRELAAGSVGQSLMMLAPERGLGLCPISQVSSARLRDRLGLGEAEPLLYAFEGGAIAASQMTQWRPASLSSLAGDEREDDVRDFLRRRLPGYMIPSAFVPLERLPLNQNGKLDRAALPRVDAIARPVTAYEAPRNAIETWIAAKWAELLRVERVGVHDNFFELGGNSLSATRIISAIRTEYAKHAARLSLEAFFGTPTVAAVAELIVLARDASLLAENRALMTPSADANAYAIEEGEI